MFFNHIHISRTKLFQKISITNISILQLVEKNLINIFDISDYIKFLDLNCILL